jgi:hypothetical protein
VRRRVLVVVLVAVFGLAGCGWRMPSFDATRSASQPFESALTATTVGGLQPRYAVPAGDQGRPTPVVVVGDGVFVVACSPSCSLQRYVARTGALTWSTPIASPYPRTLAATDTAVVVAAGNTVAAYDQVSGALRWSVLRPEPINEMLVDHGRVFLASSRLADVTEALTIAALDGRTGRRLDAYRLRDGVRLRSLMLAASSGSQGPFSPAVADGSVYLHSAGLLYGLGLARR